MASVPALSQVKIHDTAVSLLAKPFGIEKRIQLQSLDALHSARDGSKRLSFTLRSSGVKEVILKDPEFSLDIVLPDGNWASLGTLRSNKITFPASGETKKVSRSYTAELDSHLNGSDIIGHLKAAAASGCRLRLLGKAEMVVSSNGRRNFSKKGLELELCGKTVLAKNFKITQHQSARELPKVGRR
jgi:hypothetical protein